MRQSTLRAFLILVLCAVGLAACTGGGGERRPVVGGGGQPVVMPTPTPDPDPAPSTFPQAVTPTNPPQESGRDISGIEIAGAGTTTRIYARNATSSTHTINSGTWYEPKDGEAQRMIVTRTVRVPAGTTATIPAACMQQSNDVPATGLRFFSQHKSIRSGIQTCQRNCLSRSSGIQSCVWACEDEDPSPSPTPGGGGSAGVDVSITDRCTARYQIHWKIYTYPRANASASGVWPASNRHYYTERYGETYRQSVSCTPGYLVCYGARGGSRRQYSWGVGYDGREGCDDCCVTCPSSGRSRLSRAPTCSDP